MTGSQAAEWRKAARDAGRRAGLANADLDDAESVGWTAAWQAFERARTDETVKDMDAYALQAARNAVRNYARDTAKARGEATNRDWGE